jgi:hypothetical protein
MRRGIMNETAAFRIRAARACVPALVSALLLHASTVAPAFAAEADEKAKAATTDPRTAMTGTWNRYPELGEKPSPEFPGPAPIPPPPLKPELMPDYEAHRKAVQEADAKGQPLYTNYTACLPDGMPSMMMGMFPMEVLQTPGQVTIIQEAYNQVRRIYMDYELPAVEDAEPLYWGHSSGKWEGDTLVVETVGIKENVRFRDAPHSAQMRIHERLKLLSPDMMQDEVTITDPVTLTGPWAFKYMYERAPGYKMNEYVCEANREFLDPETGGVKLRIGK